MNWKRNFINIFSISLMIGLVSSCTKKDDSTPIVLPPGTAIEYATDEFVSFSQEFYNVELSKYNPTDKYFEVVTDISPKLNRGEGQKVTYTLPKDKNTAGVFIIDVSLSRQAFNFQSFVLANKVAKPSLASTLTVDLINHYLEREINTYREDTINEIENYIISYIEKKSAQYPQLAKLNIPAAYKFYKNGLSNDLEFLKLVKDRDIKFNYNSAGLVTSAPYPFGIKNNLPALDLANTTSTKNTVQSTEKLEVYIKAQAVDADNDFLIYNWTLDNKPIDTKLQTEFRWTPDYDGFRVEPYTATLTLTDGGIEQVINWKIQVANFNRPPKVTSNCPKEVKEGVNVTCTISAVDFDGEKISFKMIDTGVNARATLNGSKTDDVTRQISVPNVDSVEFSFTPNNKDALTRSAYFQVEVSDESGGVTLAPIILTIEDINTPPDIVGTYTMITSNADHEWDYCAAENPDGGTTAFDFYVKSQDPDNANSSEEYGYDILSKPVVTGSLSCTGVGCAVPITCPSNLVSTPAEQYFCYSWKPSETKKTGTLAFTFKDNHGGSSPLRVITLTASDRNEKPCVRTINQSGIPNLSLKQPVVDYNITADDYDTDSPFLSVTSNQTVGSSDVYPFLFDSNTSQVPLFRKKLVGSTLESAFYRGGQKDLDVTGGSKMSLRVKYSSPYSGVVRFFRPTGYTANITIPQNFAIETNPNLLPNFRYKYKTAVSAVMEKDDTELWVPVTIYDQAVAAAQLNRIMSNTLNGTPVSTAGLTITNPSSIDQSGTVTITRSSTASALVLPKSMEFYSSNEANAGVSSVHYYNYSKVEFAVGQASASVNVTRLQNHISQSRNPSATVSSMNRTYIPYLDYLIQSPEGSAQELMVSSSSLADTSIKIGYENLYNYTDYSLNMINGTTSRSIRVTAEDAFKLPALAKLQDQNGNQFTSSDLVTLFGSTTLSRADTTNSLTLTKAATVLSSNNGSKFTLASDVTFNPGQSAALVFIGRTNHTNPAVDPASGAIVGNMNFSFSDTNFKPIFIAPVGSMTLSVNEGQNINDFLLEVNDNPSNPGLPNDPFDRHSFGITAQGTTPYGNLKSCREKGDSLTDINSPGTCTPCSTIMPDDYWDSSRCYIRFFADVTKNTPNSDVDQSYTYLVSVNDNSIVMNGEPHVNQQVLTVKVNEVNDAPIFTDKDWNPLVTLQAAPSLCGATSCGDFVEANFLEFPVYASDPDRNINNKTLFFSLEPQIFDLQTNTWINRPSGLTITTDKAISTDVFGGNWGSRYKGRIGWTPTDQEAKSLAGPGFIIKVKVSDSAAAPSTPLAAYAFYKVTVKNVNNPPNLKSAVSFTVTADQYFNNTNAIVLQDKDFFSINGFTTTLSLCNNNDNTVFNCAAPLTGWPAAIQTYDSNYTRNANIRECRGGVVNGSLDPNVALPFLNLQSSVVVSATKLLESTYRFQWCAQRGHIGLHNAYLTLNDNGDRDRTAAADLPKQKVVIPLTLNVVAPVFFQSPLNVNGVTTNAPSQAFVGRAFNYRALVMNTRKNTITYSLLTAPAGMVLDNNSLNKNEAGTTTGISLTWTPTTAQYNATNVAKSTYAVQLRAYDTVTRESDTVSFSLQVKSPTAPLQAAPTVVTRIPDGATVTVNEKESNIFTLFMQDTNKDPLTYSWFVDGVKRFDENKASDATGNSNSSFDYFPTINEFGVHTVSAQVTDGFYTVTQTWTVTVRNSVPNIANVGSPDFNIYNFNSTKLGKTITNLRWTTEAKVETFYSGSTYNSILLSGSYLKNGAYNNFVYNLKLKDGSILPLAAGATGNPVLAESLPWSTTGLNTETKRLSFKTDTATNFIIMATPIIDRNASFSSALNNAVCLPQTLNLSSSNFNPSHLCSNSSDAALLYKNPDSYGTLANAVYKSQYDITISDDFTKLSWTSFGSPTVFYNSTSTTIAGHDSDVPQPSSIGLRFSGVAASSKNNRIYATVRDVSNKINQLLVFNASPLLSGSSPTLIATLNISDGVRPDNQASDILVVNDGSVDKVFILLPGTGGLAILPDTTAVPIQSDLTYVGNTGQIGTSNSDGVNQGRKLVYNTRSKLVYGLAKDSNIIYSIDPSTNALGIQPSTVTGGIDAIMTFSNDGSTYGVSRTLGQIFKIQ